MRSTKKESEQATAEVTEQYKEQATLEYTAQSKEQDAAEVIASVIALVETSAHPLKTRIISSLSDALTFARV